jgi:hypothetical protein
LIADLLANPHQLMADAYDLPDSILLIRRIVTAGVAVTAVNIFA